MNAAERYDWECEHVLGRSDQDLGWYISVARRTGGPVLELACGTGRIARPLAAATGLTVVGLDIDPDMLGRAGLAAAVVGDMRRFAFRPVFALVIVAYNSLQLLDESGRRACLTAAAQVGSALAVECTDFQRGVPATTVGPELLAEHDGVSVFGSVQHDVTRRVSRYTRRFVSADEDVTDTFTIASLDEGNVRELLGQAGWLITELVRSGPSVRVAARLS